MLCAGTSRLAAPKSKPIRQTLRNLPIYVLLAVVTTAVFWQVIGYDFINVDDYQYVVENPYVKHGITLDSVRWAFTRSLHGNWIPLVWVSYMIDRMVGGLSAAPYHRTNVVLHVLNALILFGVLNAATGARWRSAFTAGLFALHPMHVQSVAWIAERKDVLSTFFLLMTLIAYVWYASKPSVGRYGVTAAAFACGLMSKPMLVTLPVLLVLLDFWPLRRIVGSEAGTSHRRSALSLLLMEKLPLAAMAGAVGVVTVILQQRAHAVGTLAAYPMGIRLANAVVSCTRYVVKMFAPTRLAFFYPHPGATLPVWQVIGSIALLAGITYVAIRFARQRPYVTVGWLWYLISIAPVIGIVQVGDQGMADRYTYVPYIGLFVAVTWIVPDWLNGLSQRAAVAMNAVLAVLAVSSLACLGTTAHREAGYWRDDLTLFGRAAAVTSGNTTAHYGLICRLVEEGRLADAIPHYYVILARNPKNVRMRFELAGLLDRIGNEKQAEAEYRHILRIKPDFWPAANNLAATLAASRNPALRDPKEAVKWAEQACRLTGYSRAEALDTLAVAYASAGRFDEAVAIAKKAVALAEAEHNTALAKTIRAEIDLFRLHRRL